ncbi:hypothetical protein HPB50_001370 [Hyalomma asiaticum]|uniref:Uncharacterized protein n=1 Tax=Hyalomma asiaticum TaxID=266040 RepID=A0ACB7RRR9_HYAAI|nr:hypothetical protein HPB50_001370 [Hyalomma asiaticum]
MSRSRLFAVALCATLACSTLSHCVTYGYCGTDRASGKPLPCAIERSPAALENDVLEKVCPALLSAKGRSTLACCDRGQAEVFKSQFKKLTRLGVRRDSDCFRMFQNVVCQAMCSPRQSDFVEVFASRTDGKCPKPSATQLVYAIERSYAEQVYDACKTVRTIVFGANLMKFMCGKYGVDECSPDRFLAFVGSVRSEGGHSPLKFHYILTELPIRVNGKYLTPYKPQ